MNENERKPVKLILTVADIVIKHQPGMPVQTGVKAGPYVNGVYEELSVTDPSSLSQWMSWYLDLEKACHAPGWIKLDEFGNPPGVPIEEQKCLANN